MRLLARVLVSFSLVFSLLVAGNASATLITRQLQIDMAVALPGNPLGATIGLQSPLGSMTYDDGDLTGGSEDYLPLVGAGEVLSITLGTALFERTDDFEYGTGGDVPGVMFEFGVFSGLDFAIVFDLDMGEVVTYQDTELPSDDDYVGKYFIGFGEGGSFFVLEILEFIGDEPFGPPVIVGTVSIVPEPTTGLLMAGGLLLLALRRRTA